MNGEGFGLPRFLYRPVCYLVSAAYYRAAFMESADFRGLFLPEDFLLLAAHYPEQELARKLESVFVCSTLLQHANMLIS